MLQRLHATDGAPLSQILFMAQNDVGVQRRHWKLAIAEKHVFTSKINRQLTEVYTNEVMRAQHVTRRRRVPKWSKDHPGL